MNSLNWDDSPIEFENLDPRLTCIVCKLWLKNPRQNECGHRFCQHCLDKLLDGSSASIPCPSGEEDCEPITRDKVCIFNVFRYTLFATGHHLILKCAYK